METPTLELWRFFSQTLGLLARRQHYLVIWRTAAQVVRHVEDGTEEVRGVPKLIAVMMIKHGLATRHATGPGFAAYRITAAGRDVLQAGSDEIQRLREANERLRLDLEAVPRPADVLRTETEWFEDVPVPGNLTPSGTLIFVKLWRSLGRIVPKTALEDALYGPDGPARTSNNVSVQISYLRKRLAGSRWRIETHWGRGVSLIDIEHANVIPFPPPERGRPRRAPESAQDGR